MTTIAEAHDANIKALGYEVDEEKMLSEFLMLKSLTAKRRDCVANPFGANMNVLAFLNKKDLVRNLCVRIDLVRMLHIEAIIEVLETNKQELVLEAVCSAIAQAERIMKESGISHVYEAVLEGKYRDAGFSVEPNPYSEGFYLMKYKGEIIRNPDASRHEQAAKALSESAKAISDIIGEVAPQDGEDASPPV